MNINKQENGSNQVVLVLVSHQLFLRREYFQAINRARLVKLVNMGKIRLCICDYSVGKVLNDAVLELKNAEKMIDKLMDSIALKENFVLSSDCDSHRPAIPEIECNSTFLRDVDVLQKFLHEGNVALVWGDRDSLAGHVQTPLSQTFEFERIQLNVVFDNVIDLTKEFLFLHGKCDFFFEDESDCHTSCFRGQIRGLLNAVNEDIYGQRASEELLYVTSHSHVIHKIIQEKTVQRISTEFLHDSVPNVVEVSDIKVGNFYLVDVYILDDIWVFQIEVDLVLLISESSGANVFNLPDPDMEYFSDSGRTSRLISSKEYAEIVVTHSSDDDFLGAGIICTDFSVPSYDFLVGEFYS